MDVFGREGVDNPISKCTMVILMLPRVLVWSSCSRRAVSLGSVCGPYNVKKYTRRCYNLPHTSTHAIASMNGPNLTNISKCNHHSGFISDLSDTFVLRPHYTMLCRHFPVHKVDYLRTFPGVWLGDTHSGCVRS